MSEEQSAPIQLLREQSLTIQRPRHVRFVQTRSSETEAAKAALLREYQERELEESLMLRPFADVLREEFPNQMLESFMLWRATDNPLCVLDWMICPDSENEGIVRYLRDQMFPFVREDLYTSWKTILDAKLPEDVFWSFVCAITLDEGIKKLVEGTWKGSPRSLDCIMDYLEARVTEFLEAPFDPLNANTLAVGLWNLVKNDLLPMNMRSIILNGKLKPVVVPLSRNAHRLRRQEIRQAEHEEDLQMAEAGLLIPVE